MTENADQTTPETPTPAPTPEGNPSPKKPNKWLTAAFNMASGMAVALAVKTVVVTCAATVASPAATIFIAAAAGGVATSYLRHALGNYRLKKDGQEPLKFTFKKAALGAGFGMLGAGVVTGLDHFAPDFISNAVSAIKNFFGFSTPVCADVPAINQPATPVTIESAVEIPVEPECPPVLDRVKDLVDQNRVSERVCDALERAASSNAQVAAQGTKDLAFFLYNGLDCMPKDPCLAVELLRQAAEGGNLQAQVDLAFIEYHGNAAAGVTADPAAALEKMQNLNTAAARDFVAQWTGADLVDAPVADAPVETVAEAPAQPAVAADTAAPSAPAAFETAANATATVETGNGMDCQPIINVGGSNAIEFVCNVAENDNNFNVGDRVIIQRPGLLELVR